MFIVTELRLMARGREPLFVGAFNDTARFTALLPAGTLAISVAIARRPQPVPVHVPDLPAVVDLEQPVSVA